MKSQSLKHADLLLTGGLIYTGNARQPRAGAVAVRGNRIMAVGSVEGLAGLKGRNTRVIDLGGRFACPGFTDSHVHLLWGGLSLSRADLSGCRDRESMIALIREKASLLGEGQWLLGRGWDQELLGVWPRKEWLDEAIGDRPALLQRVDGHVAWVSSAALRAAGIDGNTLAPPGGEIVRDETGSPTGILKETASALVESVVPASLPAERRAALEGALAALRRAGVTSIHELSDPDALSTYRELREEGLLTTRISSWVDLDEDLTAAEALREQYPPVDQMIRCDTLKCFVDGTLGASTAAMIRPYADSPESHGSMRWDEASLAEILRKAHRAGFQLAMHAIGDAAVHKLLSAMDGLGGGAPSRRHRIEHAEVVSPGDIGRFHRVGAVASMQPSQMLGDSPWLESRLGADRLSNAFPWRALRDQGTPVIFGTDWPIEPLDPMTTLYAAVSGAPREGRPGDAWRRGLQFTVEEALEAMTSLPAWATFEEESKGTLEAGRLADIVVLSEDPFEVPPEELRRITVDMTVFDGRVVHAREAAPVEASEAVAASAAEPKEENARVDTGNDGA